MLGEGNGIFSDVEPEELRGVENAKGTEEYLVFRHHWNNQTLLAWQARPTSVQTPV